MGEVREREKGEGGVAAFTAAARLRRRCDEPFDQFLTSCLTGCLTSCLTGRLISLLTSHLPIYLTSRLASLSLTPLSQLSAYIVQRPNHIYFIHVSCYEI